MNNRSITTVAFIIFLAFASMAVFTGGIILAHRLDQIKTPNVWAGEVKKIDGYNQIPHRYDEQPAVNVMELEPLQTL